MKNPIGTWPFERKVIAGVGTIAVLAVVGSLITWDVDNYAERPARATR